jgi:hypothetical protein
MAVRELTAEAAPAKRTLNFRSDRSGAFSSLKLRLWPASNNLREFSLRVEDGTPIFEFTPAGVARIESALEEWRNGAEDFRIHPLQKKIKTTELGRKDTLSGELWFWVTMLP